MTRSAGFHSMFRRNEPRTFTCKNETKLVSFTVCADNENVYILRKALEVLQENGVSDTSIIVLTLFVTPSGTSTTATATSTSSRSVLRLRFKPPHFLRLLYYENIRTDVICTLVVSFVASTLIVSTVVYRLQILLRTRSCALAVDAVHEPPSGDRRGAPRGAHSLHAQLLRVREVSGGSALCRRVRIASHHITSIHFTPLLIVFFVIVFLSSV